MYTQEDDIQVSLPVQHVLNPNASEFIPRVATEQNLVGEHYDNVRSGSEIGFPDGPANLSGDAETENRQVRDVLVPRRSGRQRRHPSWLRGNDWRK